MAQSGSAPGLGPGGRKFESCCPDHCWLLSVLSVDRRKQPFLQKSAAYSALIEWTGVDKINKKSADLRQFKQDWRKNWRNQHYLSTARRRFLDGMKLQSIGLNN